TTGCAGRTQADTESAELPTPSRELDLPLQGYFKVYDNGLKLFVLPDRYTRLVQFDVRQQVGTRDNPTGKSGLAHFVEHLMFQMPVEGPGTPRLMQELPRHALSFNAYTSSDETHYMHTGTSDELEHYMRYTAMRLNYDCEAVDENAFLREREVVRNEHRWRGERAELEVRDRVLEMLFEPSHPYRDTRGGEDLQLASITQDDACAFVRRWYTASQAQVIVTGGVEPERVLELANKYLAPLPKVAPGQRKAVPPPRGAGTRREAVAPVKKPTAVIVFEMPRRFSPNYIASQAALETLLLAVSFFTGGPASPIKNWYPAGFGGKEAQAFGIALETERPGQLDGAIDEVLAAVTKGFSPELKGEEYRAAYDPARQRARLRVLDRLSNVSGRAIALADYLEEGEQPGFFGTELAALDELSSERAQQVGAGIFTRERAAIIKLIPDEAADTVKVERAEFDFKPEEEENLSVPDDIDPAEARRPLPVESMVAPEGQSVEYELDNGMRVVLVQSSSIPVMEMQLIVGAGEAHTVGHHDIAMLAARAYGIREGNREAANLMQFFDFAGGAFGTSVGALSTTFQSRGMSMYLDFITAGFSERVVQAEYRTGMLDSWKESRKEELKKQYAQQEAARENAFHAALFGERHPHARALIGDRRELSAISLRDIEGFRETHYRAGNSTLIITGGFDMSLATRYVQRFFGEPKLRNRKSTWLTPVAGAGRSTPPAPQPGPARYLTEVDAERVQTTVTIAYPLAEVYGEHHAALAVLVDMLEFAAGAVRYQLGVSYGVHARLDTSRPRVELRGPLDSGRAGEGVAALQAALRGLREREDFERLFAFSRRNVLKDLINVQGDPQLLAGQLAVAVR
ncbi:MAG: insulinase family protein, partial [Myxococcales bacterium]|nr:insulinase family protein [Myxococcales bacterium]